MLLSLVKSHWIYFNVLRYLSLPRKLLEVSFLENYDVVIIGQSAAGVSAALYTARAGINTLVIGRKNGSLVKAVKIENYYGFDMPISGDALFDAGIRQIQRLGVRVTDGEVTALETCGNDCFQVTASCGVYRAKSVLFATGQPGRRPDDILGIGEYEGRGVSYCTTCDGFFYRGRRVGILGNGNYAVQEALELKYYTGDITIFTNGKELDLTGDYEQYLTDFKITRKKIKSLAGDEVLKKLVMDSGEQRIDGLFVAFGTASSIDFARKLGIAVRGNDIVTDKRQQTNINGIFAAGDCTGGFRQVATAVGQGAIAGHEITKYLRSRKGS